MVMRRESLILNRLIFGNTLKIFMYITRRHKPFIFGMSLYQSHILCEVSVSPN